MKNLYPINPNENNLYDGPTDDELRQIEDEILDYSDWLILFIII